MWVAAVVRDYQRVGCALMSFHLPGNLRELHNAADRFVLGLSDEALGLVPAEEPLADQIRHFERALIQTELQKNRGDVFTTSEMLRVRSRPSMIRCNGTVFLQRGTEVNEFSSSSLQRSRPLQQQARSKSLTTNIRVHACELAVEPHLHILRRNRRPLLLRLEHAHRSALENHVHRSPRLGSRRSLIVRIY